MFLKSPQGMTSLGGWGCICIPYETFSCMLAGVHPQLLAGVPSNLKDFRFLENRYTVLMSPNRLVHSRSIHSIFVYSEPGSCWALGTRSEWALAPARWRQSVHSKWRGCCDPVPRWQETLHGKVTVKLCLKRWAGVPGGPSMKGLPRCGRCVDKTPRDEKTEANSGNHKQSSAIGEALQNSKCVQGAGRG